MKNITFKHAFISVTMAVVAGALLLGVQVAFGGPAVAPPGTGVSPTFTGLTVTGKANFDDTVNLNGDQASIGNEKGDSTLYVSSNIEFIGALAKSILKVSKIEGPVGKELWLQAGASSANALIKLSDKDGIDIKGKVRGDGTDPLYFNDDIEHTGSLTSTGKIVAKEFATQGNLWAEGDTILFGHVDIGQNGKNGNIELNSGADLKGDLSGGAFSINDGPTKILGMDANEIQTKGGDLWINWDSGNNVHIGGANTGGKKGSLTVDGDLKVTGSFVKTVSTVKKTNSVGTNAAVASCPTSHPNLISCSFYASLPQYSNGGALPSGSSCVGTYYQSSTNTVYNTVAATCY